MFFFDHFPFVYYDPTRRNAPVLTMDLTRRFRLQETLRSNAAYVFYSYDIKDDDRPDTMAEKYYGDSRLDWLFFLANDIVDPYYAWPLNYGQFVSYIRQKYGSVSNAQAQVREYSQILSPARNTVNDDGENVLIPERVLVIDATTYATLAPTERRITTAYEWEDNMNTARRTIRILDRAYLPDLLQAAAKVFTV